jgi:3-methylcrotonyl-CoA carboxylase alpha subunit
MEVRVGDRVHRVDVRAEGADWVVTFDGQVRRVSMVRSGASWSLLIRDGNDAADGSRRSYDVAFERTGPADVTVHVNGSGVRVLLPQRHALAARRGRRSGGGAGAGQIVAPMPGRVVSVLVAPGDDVVERQPVVVLEAMKMQNEVRAARAGVVTEVTVASGAAVEAGAVLVVLGDPRATDGV